MPGASDSTQKKKLHPFLLVRYAWAFLKPSFRKKKALLIAVSSAMGMEPLVGVQMDVEKMRKLLIDCFGYKEIDIVVLTDKKGGAEEIQPTCSNIMNELKRFLNNQTSHTRYFFYYAGHSAQLPPRGNDEEARKHECILASDSKPLVGYGENPEDGYENCIPDNILKEYLVNHLSPNSHLVAIFDSCHSGNLLGLEHFRCNRVYAITSLWRRAIRRVLESFHKRGDRLLSALSPLTVVSARRNQITEKLVCDGYCTRTEWSHNMICISACKENQKAYEAADGSSMTDVIVTLLKKEPRPTLKHFMRKTTGSFRALSKRLKKEWEGPEDFGPIAAPQVSSPLPLNMNQTLNL